MEMLNVKLYLKKFIWAVPVSLVLIFSGCEIGLGAAVDIEAPTVEVISPRTNSSVGSTFYISGACLDDADVKTVIIKRIYKKNFDSNGDYLDTREWPTIEEQATGKTLGSVTPYFDNPSRSWRWDFPLNYLGNGKYSCNGYELDGISDGNYIVEAISIDGGGRPSTPASRSFDIDNTSPVFFVSSPTEFESSVGCTDYGRSVSIRGVIADTHAVDVLRVKAYDSNDRSEIYLPKNTFTDFDKANTYVVLAAYSTDYAEGRTVSDEVRQLHNNYMALFGQAGKVTFDVALDQVSRRKIDLYIEVEDKAGNKSTAIYGETPLSKIVREQINVQDLSFEATDCMKIMNGTYSGALNTAKMEIVKDILTGKRDGVNKNDYMVYKDDQGHNYFSIAVCPNSAPSYRLEGYEVENLGTEDVKYNSVSKDGTLSIMVKAGRDGTAIDPKEPNKLSLKIFDVVNGVVEAVPSFVIDSDHNRDCLTYAVDATVKSIFDLDDGFTEKNLSLNMNKVFTALGTEHAYKGNSKHILVVEGEDKNGTKLVSDKIYGFAILSNARSAIVDSLDNYSVKRWNEVGNGYSFPVTIVDAEKKISEENTALTYKVEYFEGHYVTDSAIDESKIMSSYTKSGFFAGSQLIRDAGSETLFSQAIPLTASIASVPLQGKNVTIRIAVTAHNGQADGEKTVFLIYTDGVKPNLTVADNLEIATTKKVTLDSINYTKKDGVNNYEIGGTVSDVDGSGIDSIKYSFDNGATWVDMTAIPKISAESNWTQKLAVTEGSGKSIWLKALDKAGNESDVLKYENITFDLSKPTVLCTSPASIAEYYQDVPAIVFTAKDGNKVSDIKVKATLNGNPASVTVTPYGYRTPEATATVTVPATDGKWELTVSAEDELGQKSENIKVGFTRDKTAPVFKGDFKITPDKVGDYYTTSMLKIDGECIDTTELKEVEYWITSGGVDSEHKKDPATDHKFSITPTDFVSANGGVNVLHVVLTDLAGNSSAEKTTTIKIDTGKPNLSKAYFDDQRDKVDLGAVPAKVFFGDKKAVNMSLYGLVSDDGGIASMTFAIAGTEVSPSLTYTTKLLNEDSSETDYTTASWVSYGSIGDKSQIKAWKADFTQAVVNAASPAGGTLAISATDKAGLVTTLTNVLSFTKDSTAPVIEVKDLVDGKLIKEDNLVADNLVVHGTWSDIGGSGTAVLECKVNGSLLDRTLIDAPSSTTAVAWTVEIPKSRIPAGDGKSIVFTARDSVGNETVRTISDLVFDYKLPEVVPVVLDEYYPYSPTNLEIIFQGTDDRGVPTVEFDSATLDGTPVIPENIKVNDGKNLKITLPRDGLTQNGKWVITVHARDLAGRDGNAYTISTTVDGKKPGAPTDFYVAGTAYDAARPAWNRSNLVQIKATTTDVGAGIRKVYYKILDSTAVAPTDLVSTSDGSVAASSGKEFNLTVSGLSENVGTRASKVYLQSEDMAGNRSDVTSITLNIDQTNPEASASYYTFDTGASPVLKPVSGLIRINGTNSITVYGKLVEAGSGVKELKFMFNGTEKRPDALGYSVSDITNPASLPVFTDSKENAKSFMATFDNSKVLEGVFSVKVTDNAGNYVQQNLFSIAKDEVAPSLSLRSPATLIRTGTDALAPATVTSVNGRINITGTATDDDLDYVKLSYSIDGTGYNEIDTKTGSDAYNWSFDVDSTKKSGSAIKFMDDTTYAGVAKTLYIKLESKDTAGNETVNVYEYLADPNTDRPVINFTNVDLKSGSDAMSDSTSVWVKSDTIFGTISDDDGISSFQYKIGSGTYQNVPVNNGSWTIRLGDDGETKISFKVVDSQGTEFTSENSQWLTPKFQNSTDTIDNYAYLNLKKDTKAPEVGSVEYSVKHLTDWSEYGQDYIKGHFGGTYSDIKFRFSLYDSNGIDSVKIEFDGISPAVDETMDPANGVYTSDAIPLTSIVTGNVTANITVTDKAGGTTKKSVSFYVDNTAPTIDLTVPTSLVKSAATLYGSVNELGGKVYFAITKYGADAPETTVIARGSENAAKRWKLIDDASLSWTVFFDDVEGASTGCHTDMFKWYLTEDMGVGVDPQLNGTRCTVNNINNRTYTDDTDVSFHVMAVDQCGNFSVETRKISVNPQGDKPSVVISKPDTGAKLGGSIVIMGTAEDNIEAKYVGLMIDVNGDGRWNYQDIAKLKEDNSEYRFGKIVVGESFDNATPVSGRADDYYKDYALKLDVKGGGWDVTVNSDGKLNPEDGSDGEVTVWAFAVDNDMNTSSVISFASDSPMEKRVFNIDKYSPKIGNIYLTNGSGASVAYTDGMAVKGEWIYEADIFDDTGISDISVGSTDYVKDGTILEASKVEVLPPSFGDKGYHIKVPVGNGTDGYIGTDLKVISFKEIKNVAPLEGTATINLKIDNKKPVIAHRGDGASPAAGYNIKHYGLDGRVVNVNGYYTFGSYANEDSNETAGVVTNQTGVKRVAFYFTRDIPSESISKLYDVMIKNGETGNAIDSYASNLTHEDGLYWKTKTVSSVSGVQLTIDSADQNIHAGGLVKVNGMIYRIKGVSGTSVTLDASSISVENGDTALFALANVVDNTTQEGDGSGAKCEEKYPYGYWKNGRYDDGDFMIESFVKQGSRWSWEASVNTKNIGDGSAKLNYVVFDDAGNYDTESVDIFVGNNQPRVAGLVFETDDDDNGVYSEIETFRAYENYYRNGIDGINEVTKAVFPVGSTAGSPKALAKVHNKIRLQPEIVGGNNSLSYSAAVGASALGSGAFKDISGNALAGSDSGVTGAVEFTVAKMVSASVADGIKALSLKITDQTPGEPMSADIDVWLDFALNDTGAPVAKIRPLYWNGKDDNSLYLNSRENGHIEVSSDLYFTGTTFTAASGLMDKDPKVSGKIRLEGVIKDDGQIKSVALALNGTDRTVANYSNGQWNIVSTYAMTGTDIPASGVGFEITKATYNDMIACGHIIEDDVPVALELDDDVEYFTQEYGHVIKWTANIDTEKLVANLAQTDYVIKVKATDRGNPNSTGAYSGGKTNTPSTAQSGGNKKAPVKADFTDNYKMDVVPYILSVDTEISAKNVSNPSEVSRTALGHYVLRAEAKDGTATGGETATLVGFNLGSNTAIVAKDRNSGAYVATVNSVTSLNNVNNNNACGSYDGTMNDSADYEDKEAWAYNRQPNNANNDNLTDDVYFDVWHINSSAATPNDGSLEQVVMKVNPKNGMPGVAFSNGSLRFSMPGDNSSDNSYKQWSRSWDLFSSVTLAFDDNGNSFGLAAGGDINDSQSSDCVALMSSRWGTVGNANSSNLSGGNHINIESIGQWGSTGQTTGFSGTGTSTYKPWFVDKQRVMSPSIATTVSGTDTNVYLAYYDSLNDEIRFRRGTVTGGAITNLDANHMFANAYSSSFDKYTTNVQRVNVAVAPNTHAGEYVSIGVVPAGKAASSKDTVVMAWYDKHDQKLLFMFHNDAPSIRKNTTGGWTCSPVAVFGDRTGIGEYCKLTVDTDGNIHIACYDKINSSVNYVYLTKDKLTASLSATDFRTAVVDGNGTGKYLTIDTAKDAAGKMIPYIGYYSASYVLPMSARLTDSALLTSGDLDGCKIDDQGVGKYTGAWECSTVPTNKLLNMSPQGLFNHVNLVVHRDSSTGKIAKIKTGASADGNTGKIYGNGSSNPLMGYVVNNGGSKTTFETAQLK